MQCDFDGPYPCRQELPLGPRNAFIKCTMANPGHPPHLLTSLVKFLQQTGRQLQCPLSITQNATKRNSKTKRRKILTNQLVRSSLILACGLLTPFAYMTATDQPANYSSGSAVRQPAVAVFRFVPQSESVIDSAVLRSLACTEYNGSAKPSARISASGAAATPDNLTVGSKILDALSSELQQRLSKKKMSVMVDPDPKTIPDGALVISGCIFKADKGRATGTMIGLDTGESRLGAHIVFFSKAGTSVTPLDSFDLQVKGSWATGHAVDVAEEPRESLRADARKLADQVARKLDSHMKRREQVSASQAQNAAHQRRAATQALGELEGLDVAAVLARLNQRVSELSEETEAAIARYPDTYSIFPFGGPMFVISTRFPLG